MTDDDTFRLVLLAGLAAVLPVAVYHRVRAHAGGEKLDRRHPVGHQILLHALALP